MTNLFNNKKFRKMKAQNEKNGFPPQKKKSPYLFKDDTDTIMYGAICTLHTFGRDLQWNPHIHVLLCEEGFDPKNNTLKSFSFMSYEKLRKTFMYELLKILQPKLGADFYKIKQELYQNHADGFYVYAPPVPDDIDSDDIDSLVAYMTRYTSRPAISESRIVDYNPNTKQIHWYYHRHNDEQRIDVKEHVHNFLNNLLIHCPEKNFKMVRYYGFYSNKGKATLDKIYELLEIKKKKKQKRWKERKKDILQKRKQFLYRNHMIESFQVDPVLCSCGALMRYVETCRPEKGNDFSDRKYREECLNEIRQLQRGRT